jgi:multimeric flavodoxin WrbA
MSNRKIVIVKGSPRKNGNSTILAERIEEGIRDAGGEFESYILHEMKINPCTACDTCQSDVDKYCVIEDDMQILYPKLLEGYGLVIASPVYWFTVSAQTKLFMDRCYAFGNPEGNILKGKRIGLILTYGDTDPFSSGAVNALRTFQDTFGYIGAPIIGMVYGSALDPGEIEENTVLMDKAFQLGKTIVNGT